MPKDERKTYRMEVECWAQLARAMQVVKELDKAATATQETSRAFKATTKLSEQDLMRKIPGVYVVDEI